MPYKLIEDFLSILNVHKPGARKTAADELWTRLSGVTLPITNKNRAYFLYKGNAESVTLVGDWTYWQPAIKLQKIEHTDLFYSIQEFHPTARLQYKLIVDGNWILDPSNPHSSIEGFGQNSEFWMPEYHDESWLQPHSKVVHRGNIKRFEFKSKLLGQQREMFLYTPHYKLEKNQTLPLLIVHDGAEAIKIGKFHQILDNLQAAGKIPPCAALFISPKDRIGEYALKSEYPEFCIKEALTEALKIWDSWGVPISDSPEFRSITGASLGGLLATKTSLQFPTDIGVCIAQSPSYWWNQAEIFHSPFLKNASKIEFHLQTGTVCDAQQMTESMFRRLRSMGADVTYQEFHQSHTWGNWRTNLASAIQSWLSPSLVPNHI
jgi:enterochelin esterase family protein